MFYPFIIHASNEIDEFGLVIGRGTVMAKMVEQRLVPRKFERPEHELIQWLELTACVRRELQYCAIVALSFANDIEIDMRSVTIAYQQKRPFLDHLKECVHIRGKEFICHYQIGHKLFQDKGLSLSDCHKSVLP